MTTLEQTLDATLRAVTARAYAVRAADNTAAPYIVWQMLVDVPSTSHEVDEGLSRASVQVACYAGTHTEAAQLAGRAHDALVAAFGAEAEIENAGADDWQADVKLYRRDIDLSIWRVRTAS